MRRWIMSIVGAVGVVVPSIFSGTSAECDTIVVHRCITVTRYTNPNPELCVTVYIQNGPGSPTGSSQTVKITWSSGVVSTFTATPNADPWMCICAISNITVHETAVPSSVSTRTP